jgi:hypothetical protein
MLLGTDFVTSLSRVLLPEEPGERLSLLDRLARGGSRTRTSTD